MEGEEEGGGAREAAASYAACICRDRQTDLQPKTVIKKQKNQTPQAMMPHNCYSVTFAALGTTARGSGANVHFRTSDWFQF